MTRTPRPFPAPRYAWQRDCWPHFDYDFEVIAPRVAAARQALGLVIGKLSVLDLQQRRLLAAEAWVEDALSTAAIEGERLDVEALRSSVARRLGVGNGRWGGDQRQVDGLLDIMDDAVRNAAQPLTHERLFGWQAALFPDGYSGMRRIHVGGYRSHAEPMQMVGGRVGKEQVHYEAPPSKQVPTEMDRLLGWLEATAETEPLVRAAIAHFWFEIIHPFEDGNGRVGRNVVDLVLSQAVGETSRLIPISQRLLEARKAYYDELNLAQCGDCDLTRWIAWFIEQVTEALLRSARAVDDALQKARFWLAHKDLPINDRQRKAVNRLLDAGPDGFEGGMSTRKYVALTGASPATASRDLAELQAIGVLERVGDGRSTRYYVKLPGLEQQLS